MSNFTQETVPTEFTEAKGTSLTRELFTSNFWMSGLAMSKYIPRSFRVRQVDGMSFFTEARHDEFRNRVLRITPSTLKSSSRSKSWMLPGMQDRWTTGDRTRCSVR